MMIKIVIAIAESDSLNLPIQPLVWSVAFGPCLGGIVFFHTSSTPSSNKYMLSIDITFGLSLFFPLKLQEMEQFSVHQPISYVRESPNSMDIKFHSQISSSKTPDDFLRTKY